MNARCTQFDDECVRTYVYTRDVYQRWSLATRDALGWPPNDKSLLAGTSSVFPTSHRREPVGNEEKYHTFWESADKHATCTRTQDRQVISPCLHYMHGLVGINTLRSSLDAVIPSVLIIAHVHDVRTVGVKFIIEITLVLSAGSSCIHLEIFESEQK